MANPEVVVDTNAPQEDTEMQTVTDITADETAGAGEGDGGDGEQTGLEDIEPIVTERTGFIEYFRIDLATVPIAY